MSADERMFLKVVGLALLAMALAGSWAIGDAFGWRAGAIVAAVLASVGASQWVLRKRRAWLKQAVAVAIMGLGVAALLPIIKARGMQ